MEFKAEIFQVLKSVENDQRQGKFWKILLENREADMENIAVYYTG